MIEKNDIAAWAITVLKASVHSEKQNPVFGELNTYVSIEDDAGGPYLVIDQETDEYGNQKIRLDYQQFLKVADAAKMLMHQMYIESADLNGSKTNE